MSTTNTKYIVKNRRKNLYGIDPEIMRQRGGMIDTTENIDEAQRFSSRKEAVAHLATLNEFWQDALIVPVSEKTEVKKSKNEGWDPNSDVAPFCDDCGSVCDRGYSMRWKGEDVDAVWCFRCRDVRDLNEWKTSKYMSSHFMTTALIKYENAKSNRDMRAIDEYEGPRHAIAIVERATKRFKMAVWPNVHQQVNDERKFKGMRIDSDGLTVLAFAMCGRIRIQVKRGDAWVSGQGTEEDAAQGFGLHGIGATSDEAVQLWEDAIALFRGGAKLAADRKVGIL